MLPITFRRAFRLLLLALLGLYALHSSIATSAAPPPTPEEMRALQESAPLSEQNWPRYRDLLSRMYYAYDLREADEFEEKCEDFLGKVVADNNGQLPAPYDQDAMAWIVLARHFLRGNQGAQPRAEEACRKALALGDAEGTSSLSLAVTIITGIARETGAGKLSESATQKLQEAEDLLKQTKTVAPQARLEFWHGQIAWLRRDYATAFPLLRQGALERPTSSGFAKGYLSQWLSNDQATKPLAPACEPFLKMFPEDAGILALHAVALYRDERFVEAAAELRRARERNEKDVEFLGPQVLQALAESQWLTADVMAGLKLIEQQQAAAAEPKFRNALQADPKNVLAARFLARVMLLQAEKKGGQGFEPARGECEKLCMQFPEDGELQVLCAVALYRSSRYLEAEAALDRAKALGADVSKLADWRFPRDVEQAAQGERTKRTVLFGLAGTLGTFLGWLAIMFSLGALLAMFASRAPAQSFHRLETKTAGEVWRDRFYLVILSLSLVMFYLSVPFVVLGLLAITLALFVLMLMLRVLHIGILYRGFYAIWGVIRSAFIGTSGTVLGVEAKPEQHPKLFALMREVADRLATGPVDTVYLAPSSSIGVREEGKGPFGIFRRRRVMELGVSTLSHISTAEFKSILAHEFAHFSHQDPFYTRFISQVTVSLANSLAVMNAAGGSLTYVNPFYWLYWLYLRAYALLAAGFSRSQEYLADRRAALAYGKESFISGLTKVSVHGDFFDRAAYPSLMSELRAGRAFSNLFDSMRQFSEQPEALEAQAKVAEGIRDAKPGWFDSHPTYSERVAALASFAETRETTDNSPATNLLNNFDAVEIELTAMLTQYMHQMYRQGAWQ